MKLTAKVKYIVAKAKKWLKDVVKLPTKTQLISLGKKNQLAMTALQAEQVLDALKIDRYEQSLKVPKTTAAAPLAPKLVPNKNASKTDDSNLHPMDQAPVEQAKAPVAKVETPVQAQQQQATQRRSYGFRR